MIFDFSEVGLADKGLINNRSNLFLIFCSLFFWSHSCHFYVWCPLFNYQTFVREANFCKIERISCWGYHSHRLSRHVAYNTLPSSLPPPFQAKTFNEMSRGIKSRDTRAAREGGKGGRDAAVPQNVSDMGNDGGISWIMRQSQTCLSAFSACMPVRVQQRKRAIRWQLATDGHGQTLLCSRCTIISTKTQDRKSSGLDSGHDWHDTRQGQAGVRLIKHLYFELHSYNVSTYEVQVGWIDMLQCRRDCLSYHPPPPETIRYIHIQIAVIPHYYMYVQYSVPPKSLCDTKVAEYLRLDTVSRDAEDTACLYL